MGHFILPEFQFSFLTGGKPFKRFELCLVCPHNLFLNCLQNNSHRPWRGKWGLRCSRCVLQPPGEVLVSRFWWLLKWLTPVSLCYSRASKTWLYKPLFRQIYKNDNLPVFLWISYGKVMLSGFFGYISPLPVVRRALHSWLF